MDATQNQGPVRRGEPPDDGDTVVSAAWRAGAAADAALLGWSERRAAGAVRAALFGEPARPLLPRYRLDRAVGRGAMGEVWQAHDPLLDRDVAVKLILPRLEGNAEASRRIAREARALARLTHPNVVGVYDLGSYDGPSGRGTFIVMELVLGEALDAWLARRRRSIDEILDIFGQAGAGLAAAHAVGIVHRDFKPSNVLVGEDGRARVGDFGLARAVGPSDDRIAAAPTHTSVSEVADTFAGTVASTLTATGTVMGTPLYMAPEQHAGGSTDARADQYAFCASLFEAIFRRRPFVGGIADIAAAKAAGPRLTAADERNTTRQIQDAILRGMAPRPEDRHASMGALLTALRRGRIASNRRFVIGATIGVAIVGIALTAANPGPRCPPLGDSDGARDRTRLVHALTSRLDGQQVGGIVDRVDQLHATIAREHAAACDVDPELGSSRAACVREAARHYAAAIDVLVDHDVTAEQAHGVLDAAPDIAACARRGDAPGDQPVEADEHEQRLANARALLGVGQYDEALRVANEVRDSLDAAGARLGREATWLRSKLLVAAVHAALQQPRAALAEYEAVYLAAVETGFDALAFDAAQQLAMDLASVGEFAAAERWAAHAEASDAALSTDYRKPWEVDFMRGVLAHYHLDFETTRTMLERVIAACEQRACGDTVVTARRNLARIYSIVRDHAAAQRAWEEERTRAVARYGPNAPYAIEAEIREIAASAAAAPDVAPARMQALVSRLGAMEPAPEPRLRAMAGIELASLQASRADVSGALATATETAAAIADHPGLVELRMVALGRAAEYASTLGDEAAVGALLQAAVDADDKPSSRLQTLTNRSAYFGSQGRTSEALADAEAARDLARDHFPSAVGRLAAAESNVLLSLVILERCPEALAQSEVALAAWEAASDDEAAPSSLAQLHSARGMCLERTEGAGLAAAIEYRAALLLGGPTWPDRAEVEQRVAALEEGLPTEATRPTAAAAGEQRIESLVGDRVPAQSSAVTTR